ncbi:MAG: DUF2269 family protein [Nocardioidaceae bacterium]
METLFTVLHVGTAVFLIGPMAILPMTAMRAVRAGHGGQVASLARSTFVISLASLIVVVFGFAVLGTSDAKYNLSITTPWILFSLILYLVALALTLVAVVPALRSAAEHLTRPDRGELAPNDYQRIAMASGIASLLLVVVVVLMAWKP